MRLRPVVAGIAAAGAAGAYIGYAAFFSGDAEGVSTVVHGAPRIVFASAQDGDEDLYIANRDGTGLTKLTHNGLDDLQPLASPDGEWVAFERGSVSRDRTDTFLIKTDGTAAHQTHMGSLTALAWSPDSRMLFYGGLDSRARLYDVRRGRRAGAVGPIGCCIDAAWSPDGSEIVGTADDFDASAGIVLVDAISSKWRWLYRGQTGFANPVWSPDSKQVAFTLSSYTTRPDDRPLGVMSVKSHTLRRIGRVGPEQDDSDELAWAPGPRLVFSRMLGKDRSALFSWDGRHARRLPVRGSTRDPHWSSDGRTLAFRWARFESTFRESDIAVLQGGRARIVTPPGEGGTFDFGGWSFGPRLRRPVPLPRLRAQQLAMLKVREAAMLDVEGDTAFVSQGCGPNVLWRIGTAVPRLVPSGCERISIGETTALALTRSRLAWAFTWTDRSDGEECVMLADTTGGMLRAISHTVCAGFAADGIPAYKVFRPESIDLLDGAGDTLAFSYSASCYYQQTCTPGSNPSGILLLQDSGPQLIAPNSVLLAVGAGTLVFRRLGRIEALRGGRSVRLAVSSRLRSVRVGGETVAIIGVDNKLRLLNALTGTLLRTMALSPVPVDPPRLEDVDSEYAVIVVDGELRIVRLRDGRSVRVDLASAIAPVHARLSRGRLIVSFNRRARPPQGRVVAFSRASVEAAFG